MQIGVTTRAVVSAAIGALPGLRWSCSESGSLLTPRWRRQVLSELVSEAKFPASRENTGNFVRLGLRVRLLARNPGPNSVAYGLIPYASEQGIYFGLAGN